MRKEVVLALGVILVLVVVFLVRRKEKKEEFKKCVCSSAGPRDSVCQDTDVVEQAYEDNKLTEYTDLKSRGWTTVSPGDYKYPSAFGCGPPVKEPKWFAWDFTDFGSI
jgi:hypothetical protein